MLTMLIAICSLVIQNAYATHCLLRGVILRQPSWSTLLQVLAEQLPSYLQLDHVEHVEITAWLKFKFSFAEMNLTISSVKFQLIKHWKAPLGM